MRALGIYVAGDPVNFSFNTSALADSAPITLAGTPTLAVRRSDGIIITAGITLTVDYDLLGGGAVTGLHNVDIDTSAHANYADGYDYEVLLTAGTVDSISVVGRVVAFFSLVASATASVDFVDAPNATAVAVIVADVLAVLGTPTGADLATDIANIAAGSGLNESETIAAVTSALVAYRAAKAFSKQGQGSGASV